MMAFERKRKDKKGTGEKSLYIFLLNFLTRNMEEWVKTSYSWQYGCIEVRLFRKWNTHRSDDFPIRAQSKHVFFRSTPPVSNPDFPLLYPLLLCWQIALISSELVIDASYLRGEKLVCPQQVNMQFPHPPSRQTCMTLFDTLSLIALWHAGRIKGGIFHMQLEWKIKTMKCSVQREAGDQRAVMKGD